MNPNQQSVPPEEILKATETVRALVQGEIDTLMAENARLVEQLETTQRILVEERRWRDDALSLVRFLRPDLDATRSRADDLVKRGEALNPASERQS